MDAPHPNPSLLSRWTLPDAVRHHPYDSFPFQPAGPVVEAIVALALAALATLALIPLAVRNARQRRTEPLDDDGQLIQSLQQRGVNVRTALPVQLSASFPSTLAAARARDRLRHLTLQADVVDSGAEAGAMLRIRGKFAPTTRRMRSLRIEMELVVKELGGRYDGWEVLGAEEPLTRH